MKALSKINKKLPLNMENRFMIELTMYRDFNFKEQITLAQYFRNHKSSNSNINFFNKEAIAIETEAQIELGRIQDIKESLKFCGYNQRQFNLMFNYGISDQIEVIREV